MSIIKSSSPLPKPAPQSSQLVGMLWGDWTGDERDMADEAGDETSELEGDAGPGKFQKLCNDRC